MLTFAIAIFFLLITPGPGVLSTAGVGAAYGYKPGTLYVAGLCIGTNLVALMVVTGLAALIFSIPFVRPVLLVASVAYLTYLAAKIALSGSKIAFIQANEPGVTLHRLNLDTKTQRAINVAMAASMLIVVGLAVFAR